MGRFEGRTVLVTGATGGMGRSHVHAFHREGAAVVIAARDEAAGVALAEQLGERALAVRLDVTDEQQWTAAVAAAEQRFGPISVLVANAGVQHPPTLLEDADRSLWDAVTAVNLTGTALGIRAVVPSMRRGGGGVIVTVASTMAHGGTAAFGPYVAAKWAVRGLTRTAALELGRDRIRVVSLTPGVVATPLITEPLGDGVPAIAEVFDPEPFAVPRMGDPDEISRALLFLASPEAAFITGSELVIDGGLLLGPALPA
ncbi:SDR family NAD(P)-dependent oxidoreductase [Actinomycetospora callitridis]|uniref:SDR family NAD(P)-dependent oxidoreductase n=1 Tax=Actinomycetospora callitridis TaxID=913944 RepID=UPI0023668808|nr:SDR family oxidoreductase [Actinomycetospora callitridis]MDD7921531.1 SDR family oxidoreductase [Actinomycetospora callitridis]